ncbi:hypothetical protein GDO78_001569 [Eleutherodactylus coqui]|uniref:Uncharacterized protein n=1 Tax=Eleutherodactylus coqui TaxID=57060 RepID=A0A8J6KI07_ELECQ|nr:hypothetical protein GDO78_001569 [Eleutherodactylus coqui]
MQICISLHKIGIHRKLLQKFMGAVIWSFTVGSIDVIHLWTRAPRDGLLIHRKQATEKKQNLNIKAIPDKKNTIYYWKYLFQVVI